MDLSAHVSDPELTPKRGTPHSAGLDLCSDDQYLIEPGGSAIIGTGVAVAIPDDHYGLVLMRSGMGFKQDLMCHPGVIDSDYRGEIKIKIFNLSNEPRSILKHSRVAQLLIQPYLPVTVLVEDTLETTGRGAGGFGSTG